MNGYPRIGSESPKTRKLEDNERLHDAVALTAAEVDLLADGILPSPEGNGALLLYPWAPPAVPRSLRGRPSQVKGAFGVAAAMAQAPPLTCEPLRPLRAALRAGQRPALHNARHHQMPRDLEG